jgi:azurin
MQLPRDSWDKSQAGEIAKFLLEKAKQVDAKKRTEQDFIETTQLATEMATLAGDTATRKELRGLGVAVFVIKTVPEQLRYDNTKIVVEAGKPFEIIFENNDGMPHNLVIVEPGKFMEVGMAALTMPIDKKDKKGRQYIPDKFKILDGTKLLEAGQKEKLQVKAPDNEGDYEYVCTFPGHAAVMHGVLKVVQDVDAALSAPSP